MSSNTNSNNNSGSTSTPSIVSDWMTIPDAQLNWNDNDMEETAATKFQEKCQCKKTQEEEEHKHWEGEDHHKAAEAEQRCKAEEEARACTAAEEKKKHEEAAVKEQAAAEAQKKQQWVESKVGPGRSQFHDLKCLRCTKNNLPCKVVMGVKKRLACMGCVKLKEKCEWPAVEIAGGGSKQVMSLQGGEKKKRVRKSTMADNKVVVEGWETGQPEAGRSNAVAEAICELTRELTGQLDTLTDHILKELQGQSNMLENLIKTQQNIGWKMTWHYSILEGMLGELEVFAANLGELLEEEDAVEEEELEEVRGELEGLGPIVNLEEEMEGEQQGENQDKGKGKERVE
ncbi:hypothetical protein ID866_11056 [Astraeus odoratus]|nr:hypothetical protein ID866_11056 [Astraeus odoratus]